MNVNPNVVSNHETWLTASWIFSDEKALDFWVTAARTQQKITPGDENTIDEWMEKTMRHHYNVKMDKYMSGPGMFYDLLSVAMRKVQWLEIAHLIVDSVDISDDS